MYKATKQNTSTEVESLLACLTEKEQHNIINFLKAFTSNCINLELYATCQTAKVEKGKYIKHEYEAFYTLFKLLNQLPKRNRSKLLKEFKETTIIAGFQYIKKKNHKKKYSDEEALKIAMETIEETRLEHINHQLNDDSSNLNPNKKNNPIYEKKKKNIPK